VVLELSAENELLLVGFDGIGETPSVKEEEPVDGLVDINEVDNVDPEDRKVELVGKLDDVDDSEDSGSEESKMELPNATVDCELYSEGPEDSREGKELPLDSDIGNGVEVTVEKTHVVGIVEQLFRVRVMVRSWPFPVNRRGKVANNK
jgi:hypothetical protein